MIINAWYSTTVETAVAITASIKLNVAKADLWQLLVSNCATYKIANEHRTNVELRFHSGCSVQWPPYWQTSTSIAIYWTSMSSMVNDNNFTIKIVGASETLHIIHWQWKMDFVLPPCSWSSRSTLYIRVSSEYPKEAYSAYQFQPHCEIFIPKYYIRQQQNTFKVFFFV